MRRRCKEKQGVVQSFIHLMANVLETLEGRPVILGGTKAVTLNIERSASRKKYKIQEREYMKKALKADAMPATS